MTHFHVLASVKTYDDLSKNPLLDDFVLLEVPMVGVHYTVDGWKFLGIIEPFQLIVLI